MTHKLIKTAVILTLIAGFVNTGAYAQKEKDDKTSTKLVAVKEKCKGLPLKQRIRMRVDRFNVTTNRAGAADFGANLATHLEDALQNINCFFMQAKLDNLQDSKREQDFGNSNNTTGKSSPKSGKMNGAQVIATGEVTEYNDEQSNTKMFMVSKGSSTVKIGFTIQLKDPQTGGMIDSKPFTVEGKAGSRVTVYGQGRGSSNNPAVEDAMQHAINEAAEFIADDIDKINEELGVSKSMAADEGNTTVIDLKNTTFMKAKNFLNTLKSNPKVKDASQTRLQDGVATIEVNFNSSTDDLMEFISSKMENSCEITGQDNGVITVLQK